MRSRRRGIAFAVGALACAGLAAAIVSGYASQAEQRFGDLSEVLIAGEALPPGTVIDAATARRGLAIRRVPLEFVPPDALSSAAEAIGSRPAVR